MTIQNAPPGLDYDRDKKFSKVLVFFLGVLYSLMFVYRFCWFFYIYISTKLIRGLPVVPSLLKKWLQCVW